MSDTPKSGWRGLPKLEDIEMADIKPKKFIAIPRDAFECLMRRHGLMDEAIDEAKEACESDGMTVYVVELKAVIARADRPISVKKL